MFRNARFVAVIAAYWFIAITMLFITKHLMSGSEVSSDISVLLVWLQNVIASGFVFGLQLAFYLTAKKWPGPVFDIYSLFLPDMVLASMAFTGTLIFNNLMLKYVSVAFYQVARSLTLIFVITFSSVFLKERFTSLIFLSSFFIIMGFYISVDVEVLSQGVKIVGILYGILASIFAALCGVFFKRVQKVKKLEPLQISLNNSIISVAAMTPLIYSSGQLEAFVYSSAMYNVKVWGFILISGLVSFLMGWISALQIAVTSPLTHNISINAKSVFQTLLALFWTGESRSWTWWFGNLLVVSGIAIYTSSKMGSLRPLEQEEEIKEQKVVPVDVVKKKEALS